MSELRKDIVRGRWVIIAEGRKKRPSDYKEERVSKPVPQSHNCAFCEGNESQTPPEIVAIRPRGGEANTPGWNIRVVPNKFPALRIEGGLNKRAEGIYDLMDGIGAHEVIIESPSHVTFAEDLPKERWFELLQVFKERLLDLSKDSRFEYAIVFKNVGKSAGASLEHMHSQLIATPIIPLHVAEKLKHTKEYYEFRGRCAYCDMIVQEIRSQQRVVLDYNGYIVFTPFASRFPYEMCIVPKRHYNHFEWESAESLSNLAECLRISLIKLERGLGYPSYNYLIQSAPLKHAPSEYFHWHLEIIPRITNVAGFEWGTGFYINPVSPEKAAEMLRNVEVC